MDWKISLLSWYFCHSCVVQHRWTLVQTYCLFQAYGHSIGKLSECVMCTQLQCLCIGYYFLRKAFFFCSDPNGPLLNWRKITAFGDHSKFHLEHIRVRFCVGSKGCFPKQSILRESIFFNSFCDLFLFCMDIWVMFVFSCYVGLWKRDYILEDLIQQAFKNHAY